MTQATLSAKHSRMSARQRKKLHVGEFQQLAFEIEMAFKAPMEGAPLEDFLTAFLDWAEPRDLAIGGFGGRLPLNEADGLVGAAGYGSPSEEDRQATLAWLQARPEVTSASVGGFVDAWYGNDI